MSPPEVGNRHSSAFASRATLHRLDLLRRNAKETIPPAKKSRRFSDLCSPSIRRRRKKRRRTNSKGISGDETRRRPGRPRKIPSPKGLGISVESNLGKRKRGRPPKNRDGFKEESVKLENREGTMVDASALACIAEDPYGEELRRITVGLVTMEELLGFLEGMNGVWVNAGKKKKIVKACDFGGYLPRGWKLMLCINKKGSNLWLACHSYISPDGQEFATCKEVSAYLQSLRESASKKNQLSVLQPDNKTLEQPVMANEPVVDNFDSMNFPVTSQSLESKRTSSEEVSDEAKGTANGDTTDEMKIRLVEEHDKGIPAANFVNGDNKEDRYEENK